MPAWVRPGGHFLSGQHVPWSSAEPLRLVPGPCAFKNFYSSQTHCSRCLRHHSLSVLICLCMSILFSFRREVDCPYTWRNMKRSIKRTFSAAILLGSIAAHLLRVAVDPAPRWSEHQFMPREARADQLSPQQCCRGCRNNDAARSVAGLPRAWRVARKQAQPTLLSGCVSCHTGIEHANMHAEDTVQLGCADCHGGNPERPVVAGAKGSARVCRSREAQGPHPTADRKSNEAAAAAIPRVRTRDGSRRASNLSASSTPVTCAPRR